MTKRTNEGGGGLQANALLPSSLDAYREDLARGEWQPPSPFLTEAIEIAAILQAATSLPTVEAMVVAGRCADRARDLLAGETSPEYQHDPAGCNAPTAPIRVLAAQVVKRGHRNLASHVLRSLSLIYPLESVEGARILESQFVKAATGGEEEMARAQAARLFVIARRLKRDDLKFSAWSAFGYVALARGNLPEYGRATTRIRKYAERTGNARLLALSHDRLAAYFGSRGDHATALVHHWQSIALDDHPVTRSTALGNTAETLYRAGHFAAARAARATQLTYRTDPNFAIVALGGYAVCCAALHDLEGVRWAATQALSVAERCTPSRGLAQGLLGCADGCGQAGFNELAANLYARGMRIADAKGYHDLRFRRDPTTPSSPNAIPLRLDAAAEDARKSIQGLAPDGVSMDLNLVAN